MRQKKLMQAIKIHMEQPSQQRPSMEERAFGGSLA